MRNRMNRVLGFALSVLLAVGMLSVGALAAEPCTHENLIKGVCQNESCKESFEAAVGDTLYKTLSDAVKAVKTAENPAVTVLTDLTNRNLELGKVCLVVEGKDLLTFKDCTIIGEHEKQVLLNRGSLILQNVTIENTLEEGAFAMYSECTEGTDLKELSVSGGRFAAKGHGIGLKQMQLQLSGIPQQDETVKLPVVEGGAADFLLEDSAIEVLAMLSPEAYTVENRTPGVFAFIPEYEETAGVDNWFKSINAAVSFAPATKQWSVSDSISGAITVDQTAFTYNGTEQAPVITKAELYGKELTADTDYVVTYTKNGEAVEQTVNAGVYKMVVSGQGNYSDTYEAEFEIVPAVPAVAWNQTTERLVYSGKEAALTAGITVTLVNEEAFSGETTYTYRSGSSGEFKSGLPVDAGTYEVKAAVSAGGNYTAAETADVLTLTIGKLTGVKPAVEVTAPDGGHVYNGGEICPAVTVKYGDVVIPAEQYEVSYENNISAGTATVTVKGKENGNIAFDDATADFTIKPAELQLVSAEAENKTFDGKKTVTIKTVTTQGVAGGDDVTVSVSGLQGELADMKAGTYDKVTLSGVTLSGKDAANYTVSGATVQVPTNVVISKASLPAALGELTASVAADTANLVVEKLGEGMPADAGALSFAKKNQSTSSGATVIVYDWSIDGEGKLTSRLEPGEAGEQVLYYVTISSENYKDAERKVVVTFGSREVDASKVTVTLGATDLTYNGKEQKPSVEVKYDGKTLKAGTDYELTYPSDTINAGEKEVTVQFKNNYSGTASAKYTIAKAKVSVSGVKAENKTYDGATTAKVTATLSGVISGDDVKVSATGIFANKNSGSNKTINVTYKLSGDDAANYELTSAAGTTTATISPVTASGLSSQISGLSASNVDSGKKSALQTVVNRANAALEDTGLSSADKSAISNVKWTAEDLINRIESAAAAASTESVRKSADITKENVTLEDKALLEKAQSDLNNALTTYGNNYTKAEETDIGNKKSRIADALVVVTRVQSAQTLIGALPAQFTEDTVADPALQTSVENAKTAFEALNDYEKSLLGEDVQLKLTSALEATDGQLTAVPEKNQANTLVSAAPEEGEGFKFPTWILVVAVIAAGACGGGLFLFKRKQEENEYNW